MMQINMKDMTISQLSDATAAKTPAPGGGSISAMAAAYSASLVCMVSKLTIGKQGYESVEADMLALDKEAESLRQVLLWDIQKDSESFDGYMQALRLPKDTEEQRLLRSQAMQEALKGACEVPYQVAHKAMRALEMSVAAVEKGNINTASDGMVGVLLGRAGVLGAINNVLINLGGIKDQAYCDNMRDQCAALEARAKALELEANESLHAR